MIFFNKKPVASAAYKHHHERRTNYTGPLESINSNIKFFFAKLYRWMVVSIILVIPVVLIALYIYLHQPTTLPLTTVQVVGSYHHLDIATLKNVIITYAKTGFFMVNLKALQKSLLTMPWLEQVEIHKIWPDKLIVILQERLPVAYWGTSSLLDKNNIIFTPEKIFDLPLNLPEFISPIENSSLVLASYQQMNRELLPLHLSVIAINLSLRQTWTVTLSNNIVLFLGRTNLWQRLQHFINSYSQIIGDDASKVISVDLRYENALAIKWQER